MDSKFSTALYILLYVAETNGLVRVEHLASKIRTYSSNLSGIVGQVRRAGLITKEPGKVGFKMAKSPEEITMADIYHAVGPNKRLAHLQANPSMDCPLHEKAQIALEPVFQKAEKGFFDAFEKKTLASLMEDLYGGGNV